MDQNHFREELLLCMERKHHWSWPHFNAGRVAKDLLHIHLEHEWEVYVRDFPVLVARSYVQCPIAAVRKELVENVYEEETGGLAAGRPHPELFLEYPRGLGMDLRRFDKVELLGAARRYRALIDFYTKDEGWAAAAVVATIFLEGTPFDRSVLDANAAKRPEPPLEEHPLVKHYGLPLESLALTKAHRGVEHEHRRAAWTTILENVEPHEYQRCIRALTDVGVAWQLYREEIAAAVGLTLP